MLTPRAGSATMWDERRYESGRSRDRFSFYTVHDPALRNERTGSRAKEKAEKIGQTMTFAARHGLRDSW